MEANELNEEHAGTTAQPPVAPSFPALIFQAPNAGLGQPTAPICQLGLWEVGYVIASKSVFVTSNVGTTQPPTYRSGKTSSTTNLFQTRGVGVRKYLFLSIVGGVKWGFSVDIVENSATYLYINKDVN